MVYFLSDTHFGHDKIRNYCNRPFNSLIRMDSALLKNINSRVKINDTLYFLGDFCFKKSSEAKNSKKNAFEYYRERINCKNIIFIRGNHDGKRNGTKTIIESLVIKLANKRIKLLHNPAIQYIETKYDLILCGHVHNNWEIKRIRKGWDFVDVINMSVDVWGFFPVTINEILKRYTQWIHKGKF